MFSTHAAFKGIPHTKRGAELKKVHKEVMKHNGFNTRAPRKRKADKTESSKE